MAKLSYPITQVCKVLKISRRTLEILEAEQIVVPRLRRGERIYNNEQVEEIVFAMDLRREMGVNWPGVEVAIEMRRNMRKMELQMKEVLEYMRKQLAGGLQDGEDPD